MNWSDWHKDYEQFPSLQARLDLVRAQIIRTLDECPAGALTIVSICAGDGRDVIGAVQDHPRRADVSAWLLDNDADSVARGRAAAASAGLAAQLRFVEADASLAQNYLGAVPAHLVLLSGFLGHLRHEDVPRLIGNLPMLCKPGGSVIWNRHLLIHHGREQVPAIRKTFHKFAFAELYCETTGPGGFAVGRVAFKGKSLPLDATRVLFEFVGLDRLLPVPPPAQTKFSEPQSHFSSGAEDEFSQAAEQSIPAFFQKTLALHPHRTALGAGAWQPTYDQLNQAANRLAHALSSSGAPGDRVALLLRQEAPLIAAILAVLKAGRIVVVLNSSDPPDRLKQILAEAEARVLAVDSANRGLAAQIIEKQEIICFEEHSATGAPDNPEIEIAPDAVAFLIFTSGSTGRPKGVMQTHRNIIHNVLRLSRGMQLRAADRISLLASPSGGQGLSTLWCALLNGAALCPLSLRENNAVNLANWIQTHEISVLIATASIFRLLVKAPAGPNRFPKVRLVRIGSEPASAEDFAAFQKQFAGGSVFLNTLSSSETGNLTQLPLAHDDTVAPGRLPVGRPAAGMEIRLLDQNGREIRNGEVGEIVVTSRYLSPGYWRNEPLTAEKFSGGTAASGLRNFHSGDLGRRLPDGTLMFMDRKDTRVKIHGYRVEISEIENALEQRPEVDRALVSPREGSTGETQLVAYVSWKTGCAGAAESLRQALRQTLPGYMIPAQFVFLKAFPLTPHGKIDRAALPPPPANAPRIRRGERPRDLVERRVTGIWQAALGVSPIGRHDDYFDLGGTSLQSIDILLELEETFKVSLPPSTLAEYSTPERLAALIADHVMIPSPTPLVRLRAASRGRPLFFIHTGQGDVTTYAPLARRLRERPIFGLQAVGLQGECWPLASVPAMARRYLPEILGQDPTGPYLLAATCMGGLVAFELAQLLTRQGKTVAFLGLMDVNYPLPLTWHEPWWRKLYVASRAPLHDRWRQLRWKIIRGAGGGRSHRWLPAYRAFVGHQNGLASRRYHPVFYPGPLSLFTTMETKHRTREDPRLLMAPLAQTTRIVKLPGKRSVLFHKPVVDELAQQLQAALDLAESGLPAVGGPACAANRPPPGAA